jgi:YbbR domain-containing protein
MEGKSEVNNWFKKDMKIKIVSVLIAVLFWIFVNNVSNPYKTTVVYSIPITIVNENYPDENGYIVKSMDRTTIDVTIRGRQEVIDKIRSSDFETFLDLSQIKSVNDKKLTITEPVCSQKDVTIVSYNPTTINVQLARNKSETFPVELKSNITLKPGYVLTKTTVTPESVPIVGEESTVDSVGSVTANLDIKDLDRDISKQLQCRVYNKEGKEISGYDYLKVIVKLEVAKEVPVSLVTRGRLATDYVETLRVIEPVKVLVSGPAETLQGSRKLRRNLWILIK